MYYKLTELKRYRRIVLGDFYKNAGSNLHVYPSGLRERSAKPLFAGSNPATCSMPR